MFQNVDKIIKRRNIEIPHMGEKLDKIRKLLLLPGLSVTRLSVAELSGASISLLED